MMHAGQRGAAFLALMMLAGCGGSAPTTLLTLDAMPAPKNLIAPYRGPPVAVPVVHIPAALDRAEYVKQVSDGAAQIDDFHHWAAPLGILTRDTLVRDLTVRLPAESVLPPGSVGGPHGLNVSVTILSFDTTAQSATIQVSYSAPPQIAQRIVSLDVKRSINTPVNAAQAYAVLIGQLSDRVADDLLKIR